MSTKKNLKLSDALTVPVSIAASTLFIAGTKGSGKTYSAGVLVEEMLDGGVHVLILDPLGVWWGLRHDTDGGAGGYPVVILGGQHADAPLLPTSGEIVAEYVVRSGQSVILDMSGFDSDAEQDRFVTALLKKLFRLKATEKHNLHVVMDEADMFCPQNPQQGQQVMVGAAKTIVTKGRHRGLAMTMITQRPQLVSTTLRDESDVCFFFRTQGPHASGAIRKTVEQHGTAEEVKTLMTALPSLSTGEAFVWSPHTLKEFKAVPFREKRTFDSSRTPEPGEVARKPKEAKKVDLDRLSTEMKTMAAEVKANDPTTLKREIADLRRQLAAKPAASPPSPPPPPEKIPVLTDQQLKRVEKLAELGAKVSQGVTALLDEVRATTAKFVHHPSPNRPPLKSPTVPPKSAPAPARLASPPTSPRKAPANTPAGDGSVSPQRQRILDAIAKLEALGAATVSRRHVAALAGASPKSSSYEANVAGLKRDELIDYGQGGTLSLTPTGLQLAKPGPTPTTPDELIACYRKFVLDDYQVSLIDVLVGRRGQWIERGALGEAAGKSAGSSSFEAALAGMRQLGVVEYGQGGTVRVSESLFVGG